ncbi:MAG: hypothetical protein LOD90_02060 [Symbiobacteriaceae bacterium]|nr:MAG: hypothetical protein DIU69_07010 [Bacillota bacterium]
MPRYPRTGYIGVGKQTDKGTATGPTHFVPYTDATNMSPEQEIERVRFGAGAGAEFPAFAYKSQFRPDGEFATFARPDITALLFALLLGSDTVSGSGPYTHTIKPSAPGDLPWCSIEESIAGVVRRRIQDCRIQQITVRGEAGQPIVLEVAYLGITEAEVTASTESYETDDPFMFWQGTYTLDGADISGVITQFELTVQNIFDDGDQAADIVRADIPLIHRDLEGTVTVKFEDASWFKRAYYGGPSGTAPSPEVYKGGIHISQTYGSGAGLRSLDIDIPSVGLISSVVELDPSSTDSQEYQISFGGLKGADDFITVTVTNGKPTAY